MCQYELLVNTVPNICKDVAIIEAFKNLIDKLPLIYNNICRKMGGNNLVKSKRVNKAWAERMRISASKMVCVCSLLQVKHTMKSLTNIMKWTTIKLYNLFILEGLCVHIITHTANIIGILL